MPRLAGSLLEELTPVDDLLIVQTSMVCACSW